MVAVARGEDATTPGAITAVELVSSATVAIISRPKTVPILEMRVATAQKFVGDHKLLTGFRSLSHLVELTKKELANHAQLTLVLFEKPAAFDLVQV